MNDATVDRINRINREFYESHAEDFSRTREGPWPGWDSILEALPPAPSGRRLSILDAGCGNGRFGRYLAERYSGAFDYTGLDSSSGLLDAARERLTALSEERRHPFRLDLLQLDLLQSDQLSDDLVAGFDLVAAFGLTHHIPGLKRRRTLLAGLARAVRPGGLLAIAFWQFADAERFQRRMAAWSDFNEASAEPVDLEQIEPGDHLLTWGQRSNAVRYCHHSDDAEVRELTSSLGLEPAESFRSDAAIDRLNRYELMRRP